MEIYPFYGILFGGTGFLLGKVGLDFFLDKAFEKISEYIMTSIIFGILFGTGTWLYTENRYKKYTANK
ncbi:hypothetical protein CR203_21995 [Salipaludibacillus neizhouensis]|uniref:Uncharacterized protein n=1 Tax=Salipaludibacillus neizhouensis TaxID=885475 RepID=A0A3A9K4B1_9BACI|nr:hypothetical protein [Salipaludibacillus neizhouensis]RKL65141.1 hypothetical protein CR203_21995 [Salipaludibacillus neizhouensis]